MIIEPFQPFHIEVLRAQGIQPRQLKEISIVPANCASVASLAAGPALTARMGREILLCGGIVFGLGGAGSLWALLSERAGPHMVSIHRKTARFLQDWPMGRLEASVQEGFGAGCRWLELLGFKCEGAMRGYGIDGETHVRYARVS